MELLVATAILGLLVVLVLALTTQVNGIWRQADSHKASRRDARALLAAISADLQAALLPLNPADQNNLQFLVNPDVGTAYRNRDCFFWQAALPRQKSQSDVVMVGYFVRWDAASRPGHPVASLCRVYVPASDASYSIYASSSWLSAAFLDQVAPGTLAPASNNYRGLMAENVVGLWLSLYDKNGTAIVSGNGPSYDSRVTQNLPAVVEVALATLDPATAAQLTSADAAALASLARAASSIDAFAAACVPPGSLGKVGRGLQLFRTSVHLEASR